MRRKDRQRAGLFLAEGRPAVREALAAGVVQRLFVSDDLTHADLLAGSGDVPVSPVSPHELARLTEAVTPQGVVAVCRTVDRPLAEVVRSEARLLVCCAAVRDPGNAGTVVRCADAFGADGIALTAGSVDLYNGKTVRASVGSIFHLPVAVDSGLEEVARLARQHGIQVLAADGAGDVELIELSASGVLAWPTLWVLGNEAWGLPEVDRAVADRVVRVPIYGAAESLNLATAAAVCLYATATAQRA